MSSLVRLYPRAWRDRYEAEFLGLLEMRPPTFRDKVDIVRGAVEVRMGPDMPGAPQRRARPVTAGALASYAAGFFWLVWLIGILQTFRGWGQESSMDTSLFALISIGFGLSLAAVHALLGFASVDSMKAFGGVVGSIAVISFGISAFGGGGTLLFALLASIVFAAALAGRTIPTWLAALWVVSTMLLLFAFLGFVQAGGQEVSLLALGLPYGVNWLLLGTWLMVRGVRESRPPAPGAGFGSEL